MRGKYLNIFGEYTERIYAYLEMRQRGSGVFSYYAKRHKSVYTFVNKNTNLNCLKILSNYTIWDRLSQKTISRYCPFKAANPIKDKRRLVLIRLCLPLCTKGLYFCAFWYYWYFSSLFSWLFPFISFSCKLQLLKKLKIDRKKPPLIYWPNPDYILSQTV